MTQRYDGEWTDEQLLHFAKVGGYNMGDVWLPMLRGFANALLAARVTPADYNNYPGLVQGERVYEKDRATEQAVPADPPKQTAQERYDELRINEEEPDSVERLRAFCSLAMDGQDWLDVEPYFDAILAERAPVDVEFIEQRIKEIFLVNGFTIKEGETDLKPYVYKAAHALLWVVGFYDKHPPLLKDGK